MKVLVIGCKGQLGWELLQTKPAYVEFMGVDIDQLDITESHSLEQCVDEMVPDVIINAAAYTSVDKAECDEEQAYGVNAGGAEKLARVAANRDIRLIHISTDFVFNGEKGSPYKISDDPAPLNVYGASKLAGEKAVRLILPSAVIIRTAWVYSCHGKNFVKTMLRLLKDKNALSVVSDQIGTPTWARGLAEVVWEFVGADNSEGLYHWTDSGVCSWYDFAVAIQDIAFDIGLLDTMVPISETKAENYKAEAVRPRYSILERTETEQFLGRSAQHWRRQLRNMLTNLQKESGLEAESVG
ncbi:MAG: dTDP-4-dehydrorhamnose reductase [Kangiellaceae bacterium]|nr:dTDP-4-dehydrorhamnose reductase [Kangiellaceae bacterium]|tara:strand:+ start:1157 stop:2050 length:894 start_codon:yes stop_codon:yes gene_type:complete